MHRISLVCALLGGGAALPVTAAHAEVSASESPDCAEGLCKVQMTAAQVLERAETLIRAGHYGEAAPFLNALENAPELSMQRQFLSGYAAVETGDLKTAAKEFRAALVNHPEQTRIRLELARVLMLQGKTASADHHFRLAAQNKDLPEDIQRTIRTARGILRNQRAWSFNFDFGLAPDTNITNGTAATEVDANLGNQSVPFTLSPDARQKSGIGQTVGTNGTARLNLWKGTKLVIDGDFQGVNYKGKSFDDFNGQLAIGPSFKLSEQASLTIQSLGSQRYYGGKRAATGLGGRASLQLNLDSGKRIGLSLDARHSNSGFASGYSGWQLGAYATYEQGISKSFIASATLFARRDALNSRIFSSKEFGINMGLGGELPRGITAGVSGGVSRAVFDAPFGLFSTLPRRDTRLNARLNVGVRSLRVLGFSPSLTFSYSKNMSSLDLYKSDRKRVAFALARYF